MHVEIVLKTISLKVCKTFRENLWKAQTWFVSRITISMPSRIGTKIEMMMRETRIMASIYILP